MRRYIFLLILQGFLKIKNAPDIYSEIFFEKKYQLLKKENNIL